MMPGSGEEIIRTTGGQIDSIVLALIEATYDKNDHVTSSICKSLYTVGKHQPNLVLSSCNSYLRCHPKLRLQHKILILGVMEQICNETLKSVQKNVALEIIQMSIEEMVSSKEIVPEWQNVASGILVSIGRRFLQDVMENLHARFQPGVLPHFFLLQTMANLASANAFEMVPFIKIVLGTMLPLLCTVKQENMKWIFAYTLAHFSEAIIEYLANIEKAPDPTITKDVFISEISSAYDILFSSWLQSREAKVRSEVMVALGHMTHLLSPDKVEDVMPKFIPAILSMYRKSNDNQYTTQGLCMLLDAAITNKSASLESHLDNLLNSLFPQVCSVPDYSIPASVRNHNEVLRCFAVLALAYFDRILSYLLLRLETNNESYRIGSLTVLKHLINSSEGLLQNKISCIIAGLKTVLDSSNKVKKVIAQVIVALSHHGYLEYDGGSDMVLFIINQCALPDEPMTNKRPNDMNYVSNEALRVMCENVIQLLTTTVDKMQNILWPSLFDCLLLDHLTCATGTICKSLAFIANKKKEELGTDFDVDFSNLVHVTNPQALMARLLVLIGQPHDGNTRGIPVLNLMKAIGPAISRNLRGLWDTKIPALIQTLENTDIYDWNQKAWEEQIMEFFTLSLSEYDREDWILKLGKVMSLQFNLCPTSADKYILLKYLGLIMKKVSSKNFINQVLDTIFENINHNSAIERLGCATSIGFCSATHLDLVLVKLEQTAKDDKRNSGLFGFIKDFKSDPEYEKLKATVILCYGHVTVQGPAPILSMRIETPILRSISNIYMSSKDTVVKESLLETVKLVAEAVHPQKMNENFEFRSRNALLNLMKGILKSENSAPVTSPTRSLALSALANLVLLDPCLKDEEKCSLMEVAVSSVYGLPKEMMSQKTKDEIVEGNLDFDQILFATMDSLNLLLKNLLLKENNDVNLQTMMQILSVWMNSKHDIERERCMNSVLHLLNSHRQGKENNVYTHFKSMGFILGILIPRCTDPQIVVRHLAFDCITVVLALSTPSQVSSSPSNEDAVDSPLSNLKQQINYEDPSVLFAVTKQIGKLVSDKLPVEQITTFVMSLLNGLCDPHNWCSSGASVVLNTVVKLRGREIRQDVQKILDEIREKLSVIPNPHTKEVVLRAVRNLALLHTLPVLATLLSSSLPLEANTVDIWRTLVQDESLANLITDHCLEVLSESVISTPPDPHGRGSSHVAVFKPLMVICTLREIFKVPEMEKCCKDKFEHILSVLVLVIGQYVDAVPPTIGEATRNTSATISKKTESKPLQVSPIACAVDTLKNFLVCVNKEVIVLYLIDYHYWGGFESSQRYTESVGALGKSICLYCPNYVPKIVMHLNPMLNASVDVQRVVTVALFVEFLSQSYDGHALLTEPLVNNLLGRLVDSSRMVRQLCIRGLGAAGNLRGDQGRRYSTTILSAMMAGMDDKDDPFYDITLEAMKGLSTVVTQVDEGDIRGILTNISLQVRPLFDKEKPPVRAAAFTLFGELSRFADGPSKEPFLEQVHNNLVALLLHLNDEDRNVVKSCKSTLRLLGPILNSEIVNSMFQKHLLDDAHLHYGEFLNGLTKCLITDFLDRIHNYSATCMLYLKMYPFTSIQCNAVAFLGYLMGNLPVQHHSVIPKEKICSALLTLLKDESSEIRIRSAEALSLLYEF